MIRLRRRDSRKKPSVASAHIREFPFATSASFAVKTSGFGLNYDVRSAAILAIFVVGPVGFEPTTNRL